jgi:hypothetical protein
MDDNQIAELALWAAREPVDLLKIGPIDVAVGKLPLGRMHEHLPLLNRFLTEQLSDQEAREVLGRLALALAKDTPNASADEIARGITAENGRMIVDEFQRQLAIYNLSTWRKQASDVASKDAHLAETMLGLMDCIFGLGVALANAGAVSREQIADALGAILAQQECAEPAQRATDGRKGPVRLLRKLFSASVDARMN